MSGNEPRLIVEAPEMQQRPYSLFSVVKPENVSDPHAFMGIEYQSDHCSTPVAEAVADWCTSGTTVTPVPGFVFGGIAEADAFYLQGMRQCAGINDYQRAQNALTKSFAASEQSELMYVLYYKLANNPDAYDITGTAASAPVSLGLLEIEGGSNYMGRMAIWVNSISLNVMADRGLVVRVGSHLETPSGNVIISDPSFGTGGVDNLGPTAGNGVMWITALPRLYRGNLTVSEPYFVNVADTNEVQTLTITGAPTGGTYTLTFQGQTTGNIAYNAVAGTIQTALLALSNLDTGDVTVTGTAPNFTITFGADWAGSNVGQITATPSLTGGTSPNITMATTATGAMGTTDNTWQVNILRPYILDLDCLAPVAIEFDLDAL